MKATAFNAVNDVKVGRKDNLNNQAQGTVQNINSYCVFDCTSWFLIQWCTGSPQRSLHPGTYNTIWTLEVWEFYKSKG